MKKISFVDMQSMIENVVSKTLEFGNGYKQFFIDYYTAKFYGNADFGTDDITKIYDEHYDVLVGSKNSVDTEQYNIIIKAIDNEIDRQTKLACAKAVMSDANIAIANLISDVSSLINGLNDSINYDDVKKIMGTLTQLGNKVDSDSLVKAMVNNGLVFPVDKNTANDNDKIRHNNIKVTTDSNKDGV